MKFNTECLDRDVLLGRSTIFTWIHDGSATVSKYYLTFPGYKRVVEVSRIASVVQVPSVEEIYSVTVANEIVSLVHYLSNKDKIPNGIFLVNEAERVPKGSNLKEKEKFPDEVTFFEIPDGTDLYLEALEVLRSEVK